MEKIDHVFTSHYYYAVKHFVKQRVIKHLGGRGEDYWTDRLTGNEVYEDSWDMEDSPRCTMFTYKNVVTNKKIQVVNSYTTDALVSWCHSTKRYHQ